LDQNIPGSKVFQGAKWANEQSGLRSKVCGKVNCAEEKRVLGSKGGKGAKCSKEKNIPVGKMC
jgi:hypothetical protein